MLGGSNHPPIRASAVMASSKQQQLAQMWLDATEDANAQQHKAAATSAAAAAALERSNARRSSSHQSELPSDYTDTSEGRLNTEDVLFALSYSAHMPETTTTLTHNRSVKEQLEADACYGGRADEVAISMDAVSDIQLTDEPERTTPLLPVFLKFENVVYTVQPKDPPSLNARKAMSKVGTSPPRKQILNGITGSVAPGEILAMMGPSGSGKTTLLNILGGRLTTNNVTGTVTYNSMPYCPALKRRIGFVTQDDVLFPHLTVKETLVFAALLRLPGSMSRKQKIKRAEAVLRELGLERCQDTIVGGAWRRGVSGGERKRTSIGFEILVDPSLLFLDEPTSGLDSTTALRILQVLQKTAQAGRTILTTIHQPSSRMFHLFDKLIILSEGHTLYSGQANEAMQYFGSLGFVPQLAMNPADFLLDLATGNRHNISIPEELSRKSLRRHAQQKQTFAAHSGPLPPNAGTNGTSTESSVNLQPTQIHDDFQQETLEYLRISYKTELEPREKDKFKQLPRISEDRTAAIRQKKEWSSSWWEQFLILGNRTFKERYTDYFTSLRLLQTVGVAFLLGCLWWKSKVDTAEHIQDQVGLMFYIVIYWSSFALFTSVSTFPLERAFLVKERAADMYRLSAYYLSSTLCDFLAELVYPTAFMCVLYFMVGLHKTAGAFIFTLFSIYLVNATGQGIGEFCGASVMDMKNSSIVASLVLLVMMLTGGYYVQHIPVFIAWLKYLSFIFYGFHLLVKVWVLFFMVVFYRLVAYMYLRALKPTV